MKKNEFLDERFSFIEKDNDIIKILLERIEVLTRIIEVQRSIPVNVSDEGEKIIVKTEDGDFLHPERGQLQKENERLRKELSGKDEILREKEHKVSECENKIKCISDQLSGLQESMDKKESELVQANKALKKVQRSIEFEKLYQELTLDIREELKGIIVDDSVETLISCISCEEKLDRLFEKIRDIGMRGHNEIENNHCFSENHLHLAKLFDFYYENLLQIDKSVERERLNVKIGTVYDSDTCVRIGDADGYISEVLLQGYRIEGEIKERSIVLVGI